jgi:hypothetical protein
MSEGMREQMFTRLDGGNISGVGFCKGDTMAGFLFKYL